MYDYFIYLYVFYWTYDGELFRLFLTVGRRWLRLASYCLNSQSKSEVATFDWKDGSTVSRFSDV